MMSTLLTARFWVSAVERAIKTWAQVVASMLVGNGTSIITVDWLQILAVSGTAAVVSLLTSLASAGIGPNGPSLAEETLADPVRMTTGPDAHTAAHAGQPIAPPETRL